MEVLVWIFICILGKNLEKVLSIVISMNILSFTDFEARFRILFDDKGSKNAQKYEIDW